MKQQKINRIKPLIYEGKTIKEIAEITGYSICSVKNYRTKIKKEYLEALRTGENAKIMQDILLDALDTFELAKKEIEGIKQTTNSDLIRLRAIDSSLKLVYAKINTLQALNLLPKQQIASINLNKTTEYNLISIEDFLKK